jgi:hypothetical protein
VVISYVASLLQKKKDTEIEQITKIEKIIEEDKVEVPDNIEISKPEQVETKIVHTGLLNQEQVNQLKKKKPAAKKAAKKQSKPRSKKIK